MCLLPKYRFWSRRDKQYLPLVTPDNNINHKFSLQLQDDFLLRHYDKGPCKNKLGHSRASVIWHRTQVIGIFAGFGILLLVASPLLLLAAPCIVCCKCRVCSGSSKLDTDDEMQEESASWSVMHCLIHNFKIIQSFMNLLSIHSMIIWQLFT